ncbi:MAG: hypothetical protein U0800_04960 [Isosphaeraceae bacterium]
MSIRLIYEQMLAGALGGWIGQDLALRAAPAGPTLLAGALIGGSVGFLANVPVARRLAPSEAARALAVGAAAGGVAGAIGFGFPFGLLAIPNFAGVLIGGVSVGLATGLARWPGPIGLRAGLLGGLLGGMSMAAITAARLHPESVGASCLGALIGLALALPGSIPANSTTAPIRGAGATR